MAAIHLFYFNGRQWSVLSRVAMYCVERRRKLIFLTRRQLDGVGLSFLKCDSSVGSPTARKERPACCVHRFERCVVLPHHLPYFCRDIRKYIATDKDESDKPNRTHSCQCHTQDRTTTKSATEARNRPEDAGKSTSNSLTKQGQKTEVTITKSGKAKYKRQKEETKKQELMNDKMNKEH